MRKVAAGLLLTILATTPLAARADEPTLLRTVFGLPKVTVLESENEPNRRFEKWQERTLVVYGLVSPSNDGHDFISESMTQPMIDLRLQTNEKKADFDKRFDELKKELDSIDSSEPRLKRWDYIALNSPGISTPPAQKFRSHPKTGWVCYAWLERTCSLEGVRIGKKTMYKGEVRAWAQGPTYAPLEFGRTFNFETGEIDDPKK